MSSSPPNPPRPPAPAAPPPASTVPPAAQAVEEKSASLFVKFSELSTSTKLMIGAVILVLLLAIYIYTGRVTTDDAQVDAHISAIAPQVPGYVIKLFINDNTPVKRTTTWWRSIRGRTKPNSRRRRPILTFPSRRPIPRSFKSVSRARPPRTAPAARRRNSNRTPPNTPRRRRSLNKLQQPTCNSLKRTSPPSAHQRTRAGRPCALSAAARNRRRFEISIRRG